MLHRETFEVGSLACNCTILADDLSGEAIVVDGGDGVAEVDAYLRERNWRAKLLVHTHAHIDHIGDLARLRETTHGRGLLHPADMPLYQMLAMQARWLGLPHAPRVHIQVGLLLLDFGLIAAGTDVASDPAHVPAAAAVEDQHAAEQL